MVWKYCQNNNCKHFLIMNYYIIEGKPKGIQIGNTTYKFLKL